MTVGEQYLLRRPTALLHDLSGDNGEHGHLEPPFGPDCYPVDLPIELKYGSDIIDAPLAHAPPPSDPDVGILIGALIWRETGGAPEHDDPRGVLVFDSSVLNDLRGGQHLRYAEIVERIAAASFWIAKPESASQLVEGILAHLSPAERESALRNKQRYPVQYASDVGWLEDLWKALYLSLHKREIGRHFPNLGAHGRLRWQY
jgi:hypothetical protein